MGNNLNIVIIAPINILVTRFFEIQGVYKHLWLLYLNEIVSDVKWTWIRQN